MSNVDRVYSLNEARSARPPVAARRERRGRAQVRANDPHFLHEGWTVSLTLRGEEVDFFGISVLAGGLGRSPGSVRRWIAQGILPETDFRSPGRGRCAQRRLWTRPQVLAIAAAVQELGLDERRPQRWSGSELPSRLRDAAAAT